MSGDRIKHSVRDALMSGGSLVPVVWFLAAYIAVVITALWLGQALPAPRPSETGWSD